MLAFDHYRNHLANVYSWMVGDFDENQHEQQLILDGLDIHLSKNNVAIDLGAGHGLQSISLAKLGFSVYAVDFNRQLLSELNENKGELPIETVEDDLIHFLKNYNGKAGVITCMGDTLTHLVNAEQMHALFAHASASLQHGGKFVLSYRNFTSELKNEARFIHVKSDENRILTCFLEYFEDHVMVYDILQEKSNKHWTQKVSAYPKLKLDDEVVIGALMKYGIHVAHQSTVNRISYIAGIKLS